MIKTAFALLLGLLPALLIAAGCEKGATSPRGQDSAPANPSTVPALRDGEQPSDGLPIEELAAAFPSGYELQNRRLSHVGLGYHYLYKAANTDKRLAVTVGLFGNSAKARNAALLSHDLMPVKPRGLDGIADEAWIWDEDDKAAVRFRLGRLLCRVGGDVSVPEARQIAERMVLQLSDRLPLLRRDDGDVSSAAWSGIPAHMRPGESAVVRFNAGTVTAPERMEAGVWASAGRVSAKSEGTFRFTAPVRPGPLQIRCFATSQANRVEVSVFDVQVNIQERKPGNEHKTRTSAGN